MALHSFNERDINNNQWPLVYTGAVNFNSTVPFHLQVNDRLGRIRDEGYSEISTASYFDNYHCNRNNFDPLIMYDEITEKIMEKVRRRALLPDDRQEYDIVFLWEIDDISMLSLDHSAELRMLRPDVDVDLFKNMQERILWKACFPDLKEEEALSVRNIEDVLTGETEKTREFGYRYENLRQIYNAYSGGIRNADLLERLELSDQEGRLRKAAKQHQQIFNKRWKYVKRCLELVNRRSEKQNGKKYANVVLCRNGVALGITELLISGYSSAVPAENIFSTFVVDYEGRKSVFDRIQQRFGEKCVLVEVSSGAVYGNIKVDRWPIKANESFKFLYTALKEVLLK